MKKNIILSSIAVVGLSISLISSSVLATGTQGDSLTSPQSGNHFEIPIEAGPAPANAVTQTFEEGSALKTRLMDDRANIADMLSSEYSSIYAGTYTDDNGDNVFLLTELSVDTEKKVKVMSKFKDKIKFKTVKYTKAKLLESKEKLSSLAATLGLEAVGLNGKENKVNVYISKDVFDNKKQEVLKYIDEDMVNWIIGSLEIRL
ncbi:hypothetical protein [Paenibacillus prosopidis]|uniref:Secreted protein n=1 Tax=Paenibacillus prosopidis TaxID=630520 RepID=A0A368VKN2_9BACL|nr:hypothetical protein [Paenibacillus prosopidis]RCW40847.1 hypothetical protein DFP97_1292 [Paenibacillus prosopidis]